VDHELLIFVVNALSDLYHKCIHASGIRLLDCMARGWEACTGESRHECIALTVDGNSGRIYIAHAPK
jgi:hypothetical protein